MDEREYEVMYSAEDSFWWYRGLHELVERRIQKIPNQSGSGFSILDAGCGTGRMMEVLSGYGDVEGFDFSPSAIDFCRKRGLSNAKMENLTTWAPPVGKYDIIVSLDVLCHKSIADEDAIYSCFLKALKPGGVLLLNLPAFELLKRTHDSAVHTRKRYTRRETIAQLQNVGFSVDFSSYRLPHIFLAMLARKILDNLGDKDAVRSDIRPLPGYLNSFLFMANKIENVLLSANIAFPFGGSLFIESSKPSFPREPLRSHGV